MSSVLRFVFCSLEPPLALTECDIQVLFSMFTDITSFTPNINYMWAAHGQGTKMKLNVVLELSQCSLVKVNESFIFFSGFILNWYYCTKERCVTLFQPQNSLKKSKRVETAITLVHAPCIEWTYAASIIYFECNFIGDIKICCNTAPDSDGPFFVNAVWRKQYVTFGTKQHYVKHIKITVHLLIKSCLCV